MQFSGILFFDTVLHFSITSGSVSALLYAIFGPEIISTYNINAMERYREIF